jgi:hypothetical protein
VRCLVPPDEAQVTAVAWAPGDAFVIDAERTMASASGPATHHVRVRKGDAITLR